MQCARDQTSSPAGLSQVKPDLQYRLPEPMRICLDQRMELACNVSCACFDRLVSSFRSNRKSHASPVILPLAFPDHTRTTTQVWNFVGMNRMVGPQDKCLIGRIAGCRSVSSAGAANRYPRWMSPIDASTQQSSQRQQHACQPWYNRLNRRVQQQRKNSRAMMSSDPRQH